MEYRRVTSEPDIAAAALLAAGAHERLTHEVGVLPTRSARDFAERLEYVVGNGTIVGQFAGRRLTGFLGAISIPDFRNAGPGCYGPDWCHGFAAASGLVGIGDASPTHTVRRAGPSDSEALAELNEALARHIGASPVFMPDAHGMDAEAWSTWLGDESHVALLATDGARTIGYIKAEAPAYDVSYSVQDASVLGINGMFVEPGARRRRTGAELLAALARAAQESGKSVVSVDFETANSEAYAFWLRWFTPLTVSLERRL